MFLNSWLLLLSTGSRNTSKYFGSVDSLGPDARVKARAKLRGEAGSEAGRPLAPGDRERLQEPLWFLGANTGDQVMMTYQMPSR